MPRYEISITQLDGDGQTIGRTYGEEFFKLSNDDIAMNILGMFSVLSIPNEGSPDHPQFVSEEERAENREALSNLPL